MNRVFNRNPLSGRLQNFSSKVQWLQFLFFCLNFAEQKHNKNEANVALKKHEMSTKSKRLSGDKSKNSSSSVVDVENQENKRPTTGGSARKTVPNKWDAVMNKIATNKTNVKSKNYNEVKSKVTCGLTKKESSGMFKSPTAEDDVFVATTKRNFLLSSKRYVTLGSQICFIFFLF